MKHSRIDHRALRVLLAAIASLGLCQCSSTGPLAGVNSANSSCSKIAAEARAALQDLYDTNPQARRLGAQAEAVLVFPDIFKAGFVFGGMGGNGALIRRDGSINAFYQTGGLSYGLQAGAQHHGYALFFMDEAALHNLARTDGWEIGSSPSLVIVDQGMAASFSSLTMKPGIYAMFFNPHGLMGGIGVQGSKITRIHPRS
jgi:lipid-binding SYLF domain-containing protein